MRVVIRDKTRPSLYKNQQTLQRDRHYPKCPRIYGYKKTTIYHHTISQMSNRVQPNEFVVVRPKMARVRLIHSINTCACRHSVDKRLEAYLQCKNETHVKHVDGRVSGAATLYGRTGAEARATVLSHSAKCLLKIREVAFWPAGKAKFRKVCIATRRRPSPLGLRACHQSTGDGVPVLRNLSDLMEDQDWR